jgi:Family of unknown function (DUF6247)
MPGFSRCPAPQTVLAAGRSRRPVRQHGKGSQIVAADPADAPAPDDPVEILRVLPAEHRAQFLVEYETAVDGARRPEQLRQLHDLVRLWHLRAIAYSDPGYGEMVGCYGRNQLTPSFMSATWRHCQDLPTWSWATRLRDLMVTVRFGRRSPTAVMTGAAGPVALL